MKSYNYNPGKLTEYGKDRMRFELGDTMVEGKAETCALCDEEYQALIPETIKSKKQWLKAKLACLESIFRRFSYEVDTKTGPVSLSFGNRAKLWQEEYEKIKSELKASSVSVNSAMLNATYGTDPPPYFYNGMQSYAEAEGEDI